MIFIYSQESKKISLLVQCMLRNPLFISKFLQNSEMHCQKQYGSSLAILYNLEMVQKISTVVADRYCTFISSTIIRLVQIIRYLLILALVIMKLLEFGLVDLMQH